MTDKSKIVKLLEQLVKDRKNEKFKDLEKGDLELETKKRKKILKERRLKVKVDKKLRTDKRKIGSGKRRSRSSTDGVPAHSHLYKKGDSHTGITNKHKHKISKNGKTALAGSHRHTHSL